MSTASIEQRKKRAARALFEACAEDFSPGYTERRRFEEMTEKYGKEEMGMRLMYKKLQKEFRAALKTKDQAQIDKAAEALVAHKEDTPSHFSAAYMRMVWRGTDNALLRSSHWRSVKPGLYTIS